MKTNEVFKNPNLGKAEDRHSGTEFDSTSFARSCSKLLQQLSFADWVCPKSGETKHLLFSRPRNGCTLSNQLVPKDFSNGLQ